MGESLIQPYRVSDEGSFGRKALYFLGDNDEEKAKSPGKFCASSRGNTEGASVIRNDWA